MDLTTWRHYLAALEQREELAGCLEGTPEEQQLKTVQAAINSWEKKHQVGDYVTKPPRRK